MTKIDHAYILNAYLSRLTRADLDNIYLRNKEWQHASMNLSASSQLQAQAGFYAAVSNAVNNLIKHDVELIERALTHETAKGVAA